MNSCPSGLGWRAWHHALFPMPLFLPKPLPLTCMALWSVFRSHFVSPFYHSRLGGERDLLLTSAHHIVARVFPAPSPGQPSPTPLFCTLGGGAFSPRGPPLSLWPSLASHTLVTSHFSLSSPSGWLLSPHSPCLSSPSLFCASPSLPGDPVPHPLLGLFFTPLSPVLWRMPFPVLILNNDQIYQWGERSCVRVVPASQSQGQTGRPLPVPSVG